jgi:hypothetical protein
MRTGDRDTQFGAPARGKGATSRAARGRVCEEPGCDTILSTYNSARTCWMHEPAPFRMAINRVMKD